MTLQDLTGGQVIASKRFFVPSLLPTLNEYTSASRANRYASASMKKNDEDMLIWHIRSQLRGYKSKRPVFLVFKWVEKNKKRDHDNVAFAKKFCQDALVKAGVLEGDGWKHVIGFIDLFCVNKERYGVEVTILEVEDELQGKSAT